MVEIVIDRMWPKCELAHWVFAPGGVSRGRLRDATGEQGLPVRTQKNCKMFRSDHTGVLKSAKFSLLTAHPNQKEAHYVPPAAHFSSSAQPERDL